MDPLHHDTSRPPEMVQILAIRTRSSPGQIQQVLVVPVVLVVQELPVDPRLRFETAIEVIHNPDTRGRRQFTSVVLAVDALRIHFVGMVERRRERRDARIVTIGNLGTKPLIRKDVIRVGVQTPAVHGLALPGREGFEFRILARHLRGAFLSNRVRIHSKSKKKPPTTPSLGDESRRWREGTATLQNAEIAP